MKLQYEAKKRNRVNYKFMGFTTFENIWFNLDTNKWEQRRKNSGCAYSSHQDCKTVRAFRRKLKSAPKGVTFILCSRWLGYNVFGVGKKKHSPLKKF
jgi:hypothetical protein